MKRGRRDGRPRPALRTGVLLAVLVSLAATSTGCARGEQASVHPSDKAAWQAYRAQVVPALDRVLGPTAGLPKDCGRLAASVPPPRFGIDLTRTLRDCRRNDLSDARLYAHQQIDHVGTNDHALGLLG